MTAKSNAERVAAYRARKREQGLPEVRGIYAPKELHTKIKKEAKKLTKQT